MFLYDELELELEESCFSVRRISMKEVGLAAWAPGDASSIRGRREESCSMVMIGVPIQAVFN